ncbi:MAG: hypothetical protein ACETWK_10010 [Candidatus Aminicenantaceae bacterium]
MSTRGCVLGAVRAPKEPEITQTSPAGQREDHENIHRWPCGSEKESRLSESSGQIMYLPTRSASSLVEALTLLWA